jgi:hypothetical protein
LNLLSDLLEDTVLLAAEDGAADACESFTDYITAALPPEVLQRLSELSGGVDDDDSGAFSSDSGDGAIWFLQELWKERYSPRDEEETNFGDDAPSHCLVCERCVRLTRHHLFPREMHKFCLKRNVASADELERRVLHCCRLCHNAIHRFFSNEDLALRYCIRPQQQHRFYVLNIAVVQVQHAGTFAFRRKVLQVCQVELVAVGWKKRQVQMNALPFPSACAVSAGIRCRN